MLLTAFSINVSAANTSQNHVIKVTSNLINDWGSNPETAFLLTPNDGVTDKQTYKYLNGIPKGTTFATHETIYQIEYDDNTPLVTEGNESVIKLHNVYVSALMTNTANNVLQYDKVADKVRALVYYSNGARVYYDDATKEMPNIGLYNVTLKFTPTADVIKIEFIVTNTVKLPNNNALDSHTNVDVYVGEYGDEEFSLYVTQESKEATLLSGIIEWLKGIKEGITNVFDSITQLPQLIWNKIQSGLMALFVPTETFITQYKQDMDTLLEEKFGAVYEVIDISLNKWDKIQEYDIQNVIEFPLVSIPLPEGSNFEFGGYDVQVVPNGFEFLVTVIKGLAGVLCTILFVNGLRKRYDTIMGDK